MLFEWFWTLLPSADGTPVKRNRSQRTTAGNCINACWTGSFPGFLAARFLPFNGTGITFPTDRLPSGPDDIQRWSQAGHGKYPVWPLLPGFDTTAGGVNNDVELAGSIDGLQRRFYLVLQINQRKISFIIFTVNRDLAISPAQKTRVMASFLRPTAFFVFPCNIFFPA